MSIVHVDRSEGHAAYVYNACHSSIRYRETKTIIDTISIFEFIETFIRSASIQKQGRVCVPCFLRIDRYFYPLASSTSNQGRLGMEGKIRAIRFSERSIFRYIETFDTIRDTNKRASLPWMLTAAQTDSVTLSCT